MSENVTIDMFEKEAEEMTAMHIISKDDKFESTEGGFVNLTYNGKKYEKVNVVRLFPFTDANKYISIRANDDKAKEIGIIKDLDEMPDSTKKMLTKQLDLNYFTPVIKKIHNIKEDYGYAYFSVLTDKGECEFAINMASNAVTKLSDNRLIIMDLDENRFEIRDVNALTMKEKRKLDLFL